VGKRTESTRVAIVGGARTPFVKAGGVFSHLSSLDLGLEVVSACVDRVGIDPTLVDELFFGTVLLDPRYPNLAREIILRSGLPKSVTGHFVSNNCITGLVAASSAVDAIRSGRIKVAIVGGSESMSMPTLTYPRAGEEFFLALARRRDLVGKLRSLSAFRPRFLVPQAPSPKEPSTGLTMGQHCEIMAQEFQISRSAQDEVALLSHQRASKAQGEGILGTDISEVGEVVSDGLIRENTSLEKLAGLKPVFDRSGKGSITAGNASALTDGASAVCLVEEGFANEHGLHIHGYIEEFSFASVPPGDGLLMAPALAVPRLMNSCGIDFGAVDAFEIHEAFAAQVLCNEAAWRDGWSLYPDLDSLGPIDPEKRNIFGGSIALGHPFAATGGRMLLNACQLLSNASRRRVLISICAAGGGAGAVTVVSP
jgi:acetyl-CoA acetyltransferase family protein